MAAEDRKIVIEIIGNGTGQESSNPQDTQGAEGGGKKGNDGLTSALSKMFHPVNTLEEVSVGKNVIIMQAYNQAKQNLLANISFFHDRYFSLKEDYLSETTYQNAQTAIGKIGGFMSAVGSGAMMGASLGPVGAAVGAAIGGIGYGITEFTNRKKTMSQYYQQLNASSFETEFMRERAGLVNDSRGTEN